jgi:hypothetical protein
MTMTACDRCPRCGLDDRWECNCERKGVAAGSPVAPSVCETTLRTALELTGGDRAKQHGDKRVNHQNIADLWNAYFGVDAVTGYRHFTAHDVAVMMCLLKIARLKSGSHNPDNYVDLAGYAGIAAECAE